MRLSTILLALVLATPAHAQAVTALRITEILVDPVGSNAGAQVVEVENIGNTNVDLNGWHLVANPTSAALPSVRIPYPGIARIHLGAQGVNSQADIYLPGFRVLGRSETLAIYKSAQFGNPKDLIDFVSWGGGTGNIAVAVQAAQWPSTLVTTMLPAGEGHTLAHYGRHTWGNGDSPEDWYQDTTPTLGLPNDPGSAFGLQTGCPNLRDRPSLGLARPQSRPWIGETWELDAYNMPHGQGVALLFFGLQTIAPLPLALAGMPGCHLHVQIDGVAVVARTQGSGRLTVPVPRDAAFVGLQLYLQALVPDASYANQAKALVTNAVVATFGSR